uniref:WD repeat domain 93 n=1 Tax=Strix occidentalis caurina TaxID=311401 RepID=A0A8D0EM28_STROC
RPRLPGNRRQRLTMAAYIWKHPLEIPPPSEKDWLKEDEEDFFLQDPDRKRDVLPQPFRMINKLVMLVFENAMEIIERKEMLQEAQKLKVQPAKCIPTAEFQVTGRANCLVVSGKYVFVGLSVGLAAFKVSDCKEVCAWDAVKTEICAIHASDLGNECHVLLAVDEMGILYFKKYPNLVLRRSDNRGCLPEKPFLLISNCSTWFPNADSTEAWLEIYRLPKDSWLKEMEKNPGAAAGLACRERRSSWTSVVQNSSISHCDSAFSLCVPKAGSSFKSPLDALKKVDDGSMLGLGYNHLIKDSQWEQQEAIFRSTYREYLEAEGERENVPAGISVHWDGSHNLYSDLKPDVVWPCAAPIACSAVSSCSRYLALACEDATITIWDKHLGYPLSVTAILEERLIRSIHFLRSSAAASDETLCPGTDPACPIVQLLVLCTDSSFYLVKAPRTSLQPRKPCGIVVRSSREPQISVEQRTFYCFYADSSARLLSAIVYCFSTPPSHAVACPWQPVFTVDTHCSCFCLGDKQQQADVLTESRASHSTIFLFEFSSYPLEEAFPKEPDLPPKSLQNLPWIERCNIFLRDR